MIVTTPKKPCRDKTLQGLYLCGVQGVVTGLQSESCTLKDYYKIHGSKRSVEIHTYDCGHTESDAFVYPKDENLAFMADLVLLERYSKERCFFDALVTFIAPNIDKMDGVIGGIMNIHLII